MDEKRFNKLLKKIKADSNAFTEIYNYYFPKIIIHTAIKFNNKSLGEDAAQEFFRKLLEMDIPDKVEKPTSWVYTISDNAIKNLLLKRKREFLVSSDVAQDLTDVQLEQEIYGEYSEKLEQLDEATRTIIKMHVWEGYSLKEIADKLNLSYDGVRQKYSRGMKNLKK